MKTVDASFSAAGAGRREPVLSNSLLGVIVFILTEMMFFVSLISAYLVSAAGAAEWPPADQPRLPAEATAFNSLALLVSGVTVFLGFQAMKRGGIGRSSLKWMLLTIVLGTVFVAFQGFEWAKLISYGLTMTSSNYGSFFYLLIGAHGIHAVGALIALFRAYMKMRNGSLAMETYQGTMAFWFFVVGVWPALYVLVYLN